MQINIDGYNINYKVTGSGDRNVCILQGWGTELGLYDSVSSEVCAISEEYRVYQLDLPGFGSSDEPKQAWSVDDFTDFFCKFTEALGIKKTILIGHSYGGRMIIKLASRESIPFEIERIILIDSAGIMPKRSLWQKIKVRRYKILRTILTNKVVYALFPEVVDEWKSRQGSADYKNATPIMRQCLVKAVNEDQTEALKDIKQDTLLIWGEDDTATPVSDAKVMEQNIPHAGLVTIPGAGHYSFLEKRAVFNGVLRAYLKTEDKA